MGPQDAGRHYLGRQVPDANGTADPKRIGILGGSYGGYATLAGVAFTPDVYRAAVDIVGPSNLRHLARLDPSLLGVGSQNDVRPYGRFSTPEGKAWMQERSPLNSGR